MADLRAVRWTGAPPPAAVVAALAGQGAHRDRAQSGHDDAPLVVCTRDARRVPARTSGSSKWLWVSSTPVAERLQLDAVVGGAYDVVSLKQADAAALIALRLRELLTPAPVIPPADL